MDWGVKFLIKSYMNPDFGKTGFGEKINCSEKRNKTVSDTALRTLQRKTDSRGILESKEEEITTSFDRQVAFQSSVIVILIPTKEEFVEAGLAEHIWWSRNEQDAFKSDLVEEVKIFFKQNPGKSPRKILREFNRRMNFPSIEQESRDTNL